MENRAATAVRGWFEAPGFAALLLVAVASFARIPLARAQAGPGSAHAAADSATNLAPTTAVPWNPPRAVSPNELWEEALNAPLTLASLPLRLVGEGVRAGLLKVQEEQWIPKLQLLLGFEPPWGIGLRPAGLGDRTGTGGAVTLTPPPARGWLRASLEGSTLRYGRGHVELGSRAVFASYTHDWRPQDPFFGVGMDAREGDVSNYALRSRRAEARARVAGGSTLRHDLSAWAGERRSVMRRGRDSSRPSLEQVFPQLADASFDQQQDHAYAGASLALDTRGGRPHWSHGWRLAGSAEYLGHPLSGRGVLFAGRAASPAFGRTELAAETGVSFMRDPRTLRFSARVADTRVSRAGEPLALHDLVTLGGSAGLAGFEPGRFRGLDLALARVEYVFPLAQYAELALTGELGGVYDDLWNGGRLDQAEASYGVSYRLRTERAPVIAFGLDMSREGVRFGFDLGGVE